MDAFCMPADYPGTLALMGLILVVSTSYVLFVPQYGPRGGERPSIFANLMAKPVEFALLVTICGALYILTITIAHFKCPAVAVAASFRTGTHAEIPPCFQHRSFPKEVFRPTRPSGSYILLEGPHGCGKTTAIQWEAHSAGAGVVYVSVPANAEMFGIEFASAFGLHDFLWWTWYSPFISHQLFSHTDVFDAVSRTCDIIRTIGLHLSQELGKPLVLVIDNAAKLAKVNPRLPSYLLQEVLNLLQDIAKDGADEGWLRVIISASEGLVPQMLHARSSSSRMVVRKMGDVNSTVAVEYLRCRGIAEASAEQVVNITGGRFAMLQKGASWMLGGDSVHSLEENLRTAVGAELNVLGVETEPSVEWHDSQKRSKAFWEVSRHIVSYGYISTAQHNALVSNLDDRAVLQASNIFMFANERKVSFQSRPVELYMRLAFIESGGGL